MQEILVSVDGSAYSLRGLTLGRKLGKQLGMPVKLYSIVPDTQAMEDRRHAIERSLESVEGEKPKIEVVPDTSPAQHLAEMARNESDVLLCMTTHGRRPVTEALLGSVAAQVVRDSGRLVFLAGPKMRDDDENPIKQLIVCVDGSPLSEDVLPHAVELAQMLKARVQLVHVVEPDAVPGRQRSHSITDAFGSGPSSSTNSSDIMESNYVQSVARQLKEKYGVSADWDVLHGENPGEAISSYASAQPGAMLVMTTHGRGGLAQVALGSVSHAVLHETKCPVAVFRPEEQV
jgi:nucleotide-binding universal stress UspA family protein